MQQQLSPLKINTQIFHSLLRGHCIALFGAERKNALRSPDRVHLQLNIPRQKELADNGTVTETGFD